MNFHYIAPSVIPSRAANAVHVVWQCDALARAGAQLTLYAKRSVPNQALLVGALADAYGVDATPWRVVSYYSNLRRGDSLRIAALAVNNLRRQRHPDAILSRNLYAAFVLAVVQHQPLLFETHQLEYGARRLMQRAIMSRPWVTTVAISQSLVQHLAMHHRVAPSRPLVLHDAAPSDAQTVPPEARRGRFTALVAEARGKWLATCAYFGHLYAGRGIELIEEMAKARPLVAFFVFGGNDATVAQWRARNRRSNLFFIGFLPHVLARQAMAAADILLMPYQTSVSLGVRGHDTARWMSPMKMFEYLSTGVPVISSDLPVLREVLEDGRNALLVAPDRPQAWIAALDRLTAEPLLGRRIGETGRADYLARHTWDHRARALLAAAERL